ncbi:TPA: hypothetical protein DD712_01135 [Candidatus Acetothermia bacterium]|nr:hypothetical protein [Candidatus Acetothermia bacterium]
MHKVLMMTVFLMLLLGMGATATEAAGAPIREVGDYWQYQITATGRDGELTQWITTEKLLRQGILYDLTSSMLFTDEMDLMRISVGKMPAIEERLWFPLVVDKSWTRTHITFLGTETMIATVLGFEKVETPAGEFEAFHIRVEVHWERALGRPPAPVRVTELWYSPQVRNYVRQIRLVDGEIMSERLLLSYGRMILQEAIEKVLVHLEAALADWALFRGAIRSLMSLHQHGIESDRVMEMIRTATPPPLPGN